MLSKWSAIALGSALVLSLASPKTHAQTGNTGYVRLGKLINRSDANVNAFWIANYDGGPSTEFFDLFRESHVGSVHQVFFKVAFDRPQSHYVGMNVSYVCSSGHLVASEIHFSLFGVNSRVSDPQYIDVNYHWFFAALGNRFCNEYRPGLPLPTETHPTKPSVEVEPKPTGGSVEVEPKPTGGSVEVEPKPTGGSVEVEPESTQLVIDAPLDLEPGATAGAIGAGAIVIGGAFAANQNRKKRKQKKKDLEQSEQGKSLDIAEKIFSDQMIKEIDKKQKLFKNLTKIINDSKAIKKLTMDDERKKLLDSLELAKDVSVRLKSIIKQGKGLVDDYKKLKSGEPKSVVSVIKRVLGMVKGAAPVLQAFTMQLDVVTELVSRADLAWQASAGSLNHIGYAIDSLDQPELQEIHELLAAKKGEKVGKMLSPEGFVKDMSDAVLNHIFKGSQSELLKFVPESFKETSQQIIQMHGQLTSGPK